MATYKLENIVRQRNAPELIYHFKAGEMVEGLESWMSSIAFWGSRIGVGDSRRLPSGPGCARYWIGHSCMWGASRGGTP